MLHVVANILANIIIFKFKQFSHACAVGRADLPKEHIFDILRVGKGFVNLLEILAHIHDFLWFHFENATDFRGIDPHGIEAIHSCPCQRRARFEKVIKIEHQILFCQIQVKVCQIRPQILPLHVTQLCEIEEKQQVIVDGQPCDILEGKMAVGDNCFKLHAQLFNLGSHLVEIRAPEQSLIWIFYHQVCHVPDFGHDTMAYHFIDALVVIVLFRRKQSGILHGLTIHPFSHEDSCCCHLCARIFL